MKSNSLMELYYGMTKLVIFVCILLKAEIFFLIIYYIYYEGGVGKVFEIDKSKFGRRKYYRGHRVEGQWVFGGVERMTSKFF